MGSITTAINALDRRMPGASLAADSFAGEVYGCAAEIQAGSIRSPRDVIRVADAAGRIMVYTRREYGTTETTFVAPDGSCLAPEAAGLVYRMAEPQHWRGDDEREQLERAKQLFSTGWQTELDVPSEMLESVIGARSWLAGHMGLANPYCYRIDELALLAEQHLRLTEQLRGESQLDPQDQDVSGNALTLVPRQRSGSVVLEDSAGSEAVVSSFPTGRSVTSEYRVLLRPRDALIRSHRIPEQRRRPGKLRRVAAIAAVALLGVFAPMPNAAPQGVAEQPAIVEIETPRHPVVEPLITQSSPDRILTPGAVFDLERRTGAIQFMVEDYAAELGSSNLTMLQADTLTRRTLAYMDSRMPGGMNWVRASRISVNTRLPFPPPETMRVWLSELGS